MRRSFVLASEQLPRPSQNQARTGHPKRFPYQSSQQKGRGPAPCGAALEDFNLLAGETNVPVPPAAG